MANLAARGDSKDTVQTKHGCTSITTTDECSPNVFVGTGPTGIVRLGDKVHVHTFPPIPPCPSHQPPLTVASTTVLVNNKGAGRKGDLYIGEEIITGWPTVVIGG